MIIDQVLPTSGAVRTRRDLHDFLIFLFFVSFLDAIQLVHWILGGQRGKRADLQFPAATPPVHLQATQRSLAYVAKTG